MTDVNLDVGFNINQTALSREINRAVSAAASTTKPVNLKLNSGGFTQPLGKITAQLSDFDKSLDAASARVLAFGASVAIINTVKNAFTSLIRETVKVKDELAEINVLLGLSASNLKVFSRDLFEAAKNTRQTFEQAATAAAEFSRQGLSAEETLKRTTDALKLTRISGLEAAKSVETLTASVNGFVNSAIETTEVVNKLANVDAAFAVSSADLAESLARAGSTAQDANISFEELLALTTAVQQQTARGGAVIGNAFKTIFARVSRQTSIDQLRELGVAIDQSQSGVQKLKAIGNALEDAGESTRSRIAEITGGVRQINIVSAAFRDLNREASIFDSALGIAINSTNEADKRIEQLNKTLGSLANESLLTVQELFSSIGDVGVEDNLKTLVKSFNDLFGGITNLISGEGVGSDIARSVIEGISNFVTGPGLAIAAKVFIKLFAQVAKDSSQAFKSIVGITSEAQRQQAIQKTILQILDAQGGEYKELILGAKTKADQEKIVLEILNQQIKAQNILQKQSAAIAASPALRGFSVGKGGIVKTGADGVLPTGSSLFGALIKEQKGIAQGKGGASSGASPVLLPNFNFGQGQKGPLVVNTDEYIIKNFDGKGGSAVLTQDMIKSLGGINTVKELGGEKVPFAVDGNVPFSRSNVRQSSGQFVSQKTVEKLNKIADRYVKALGSGTEKAQNTALKNFEKLTADLNSKSKLTIDKFVSKAQTQSRVQEFEERKRIEGQGALTRAQQFDDSRRRSALNDQAIERRRFEQQIRNKLAVVGDSQALENFQGGQFLGRGQQQKVGQLLEKKAFESVGLSEAEINRIFSSKGKLPDEIKKSVNQIESAIQKRIDDQQKVAVSSLIQQRDVRRLANLQSFEEASNKGRVKRFFTGKGVDTLPEFQRLTPSQQRQALATTGVRGAAGRVGRSLGAGIKNPIGLSLATSFLAPVAERAATRTDGTQNLAGAGVAGALQGASFGALLGPWGAAVGALAGGLKSLAEAADPAANSIIKLTNQIDKQREIANKNTNALQQAIQQQSNIGQLISSGNTEAIRRNQDAFTESIASLSGESLQDDVRDIILGAEGNTEKIVNGLEKLLSEQQRQNQIQDRLRTTGLGIATAEKENRGVFNVGGIFGETNIQAEQLKSVANDVSIAIASIIDDGKMEEVQNAFNNLSGEVSDQNFINAFTSFAETPKQFREFAEIAKNALGQLGDDEDLNQLVKLIDKRREEREEARETSKEITQLSETLSEATKRLSQTVSVVNRLNEVSRLQSSVDFAAAQRGSDLKFAFAQFSNPITESLITFAKDMKQIQFEESQQIAELSDNFRSSITNLVQSSPQAFGDQFEDLKSVLTDPNFKLTGETLKLIESAINESGNTDIKSYQKLIELTQNSLGELGKVSINTEGSRTAAEHQLRISEARAAEEQRQRNTNFLGGIESLLSGSQTFNRFSLRDNGNAIASGAVGRDLSSRRALDIVNFQQAFQPVGINASQQDQERVLKEIVANVADAFVSATGTADTERISKISQDIFEDFFKKNELTPENIASAIGNEDSIKNISSSSLETSGYTEPLEKLLEKLVILQETSGKISEFDKQIQGKRKEVGVLENKIKTERGVISTALTNSKIQPFSRNQLVDVFDLENKDVSLSVTQAFNEIIGKDGIAIKDISIQKILDSNNFYLDDIAKSLSDSNINTSEDFARLLNQKGIIDINSKIEDVKSLEKSISDSQLTISEIQSEIANLKTQRGQPSLPATGSAEGLFTLPTGVFAERDKRISSINKGGIGSTVSSGTGISQLTASIITPMQEIEARLDEIARVSEVNRLASLAGAEAESRRQQLARASGVSIDGPNVTGGPENLAAFDTLQEASKSMGDLLSGGFTELDLIISLQDVENSLKEVGLSLEDENIKKLIFGEGAPEKFAGLESLSENLLKIAVVGIETGEALRETFEDPFSTVAEQGQILINATETLDILKEKFGETSEEVKEFKKRMKELSGVKLPEENIDKFLLGVRTGIQEISDSLPTVAERGEEVASDLIDGFTNAFDKIVFEGEDFGDSIKSIFADILREQANLFAKQGITSLFEKLFSTGGNGSGSSGGGVLDSLFSLLGGGSGAASSTGGGGGFSGLLGNLSSIFGGGSGAASATGSAGLSALGIPGLLKAGAQFSPLKMLGITSGKSVVEGGGIGGIFGSLFKGLGIFHNGGDLTQNPQMSSLLGLKSNEVPFIGYEGERVISRNQSQASIQEQNNVGNPIQLTIINVVEKDDLATQLQSAEGGKALVNHISNNKKTTRRALEL